MIRPNIGQMRVPGSQHIRNSSRPSFTQKYFFLGSPKVSPLLSEVWQQKQAARVISPEVAQSLLPDWL